MKDLVRRHPAVAALAAYALFAVLATWPLAARFGTAIAGDRSGPWETLWSLWSWGESVAHRGSPGLAPWPRFGNVPAALALLPLWPATPHLPEVALYNLVLFASYPLAGLTMYLLCREVWGGHLAPFLAGALYTFAAHHLGAAAGPLEAVSLEWAPLYFLGLVRTLRRHGPGPPLLAGAALALAATTSPYQLAGCAVGTAVLVVGWWRTDPRSVRSAAFLRRAGLLLVTFAALAGWFYGGLLPGRVGRAASGTSASADLLAFLVPVWSVRANGGSAAPVYAGYVTLALAVVAWTRAKASRPWLAVAIVGAVLAVGARLQVGGTAITPALLPFAWVGWIAPSASGTQPARLAWLVSFGLAIGACAALSLVIRSHRRGAAIAVGVTALALVEAWPGAMPTSSWPAPRFLRDLARDGERWAVLDATAPDRQLWHQVLHRHPRLGGGAAGPAEVSSATGSVLVDRLVHRASPLLLATEPARFAPTRAGAASLEAIRVLQQRNVRFVIADERTLGAARALRLPPAFAGDGIVVFEVPAPTG